jgi:hypothetical protein
VSEPRRIPELGFDTSGLITVSDNGSQVELWAYDDYGDSPAFLSVDQVRQLRDWLSAWLGERS